MTKLDLRRIDLYLDKIVENIEAYDVAAAESLIEELQDYIHTELADK